MRLPANGVSLTRTNGEIFYNGALAADDSFHYTVASVAGDCTATALVTYRGQHQHQPHRDQPRQ